VGAVPWAPRSVAGDAVTREVSLIQLGEPIGGIPQLVETPDALSEAVGRLAAGTGPVAIDSERASGFRYGQRAYLVQLFRQGTGAILIDPIACPNLSELSQVLDGVEWVLHAASQDLPSLADTGMVPQRLFDTELAGRLLGYPRVGLAVMVAEALGYALAKEHSAADWSRRPLPASWLAYAVLDVELLVDLRDALVVELELTGKTAIATQEFEAVRLARPPAKRPEPWRRTSGAHEVKGARRLAIVRELWNARDQVAQERDLAPGRLLPDTAIIAAAEAAPRSLSELRRVRAFTGRAAFSDADRWLEAINAAIQMPREMLPSLRGPRRDGPPPHRSWPTKHPVAAARLAAARHAINEASQTLQIPPENILQPDILRQIIWSAPEDVNQALAIAGARPWQRDLTAAMLAQAIAAHPGTPGEPDDSDYPEDDDED